MRPRLCASNFVVLHVALDAVPGSTRRESIHDPVPRYSHAVSLREKLARAEASLAARKASFQRDYRRLVPPRRSWGLALAVVFVGAYGSGFAVAWRHGEQSGMPASAPAIAEWSSNLDNATERHAACREETRTYQGAWTACREEQTHLGVPCRCEPNETECGCTP